MIPQIIIPHYPRGHIASGTPFRNNLAHFYDMESATGADETDQHGSNDALEQNTVPGSATGGPGGGGYRQTDNSSNYHFISTSTGLNFSNGFAMGIWFKGNSASGTYLFGHPATGGQTELRINGSGNVISIFDAAASVTSTFANALDNAWHSVFFCSDQIAGGTPTVEKLFVDGSDEGSGTRGFTADAQVFNIGADDTATQEYTGFIGPVAIWDIALGATAAASLASVWHNSGTGLRYADTASLTY